MNPESQVPIPSPQEAKDEALTEVSYRTIDTPVGVLLLASTAIGLVRVAFECENFSLVLDTLAARIGPRVVKAPRKLDSVAAEMDEFFAGTRTKFETPMNYALTKGFRKIVQQYLPRISYGSTLSYKEVAENVGRPTAVRAVGTACSTNPLPVVLPCHRVLRSDGTLGGYIGGLDAKLALLNLEKAL